jgi:hypothetical protein
MEGARAPKGRGGGGALISGAQRGAQRQRQFGRWRQAEQRTATSLARIAEKPASACAVVNVPGALQVANRRGRNVRHGRGLPGGCT